MYLLCYGRSDNAKRTGKLLMDSIGGRWIYSEDFFASSISCPSSDDTTAFVMLLPLEAACEIASSISQPLGNIPVVCVSPEGKFAATVKRGSLSSEQCSVIVKAIADELGNYCFTSFGSNADIAPDIGGMIRSYSMTVSDDVLCDRVKHHIAAGGRVSLYTDMPVVFGEPVLDSMLFELHRYTPETHDSFIQAYKDTASLKSIIPAVFITCRKLPDTYDTSSILVLTPRLLCLGIELKTKLDPQYSAGVVRTSLENHLINPASVSTIAVSSNARDSDIIRCIADDLGASVTAYSARQIADVRLPLKMTFAPDRQSDIATAAAYMASSEGKILIRRSGGNSGVVFSAALRNDKLQITEV